MASGEAAAIHEDEIRRAAEMREWLEQKIRDLEEEATHYKDMMVIVDSILRSSSFVPAAKLRTAPGTEVARAPSARIAEGRTNRSNQGVSAGETRPLRRSKDGELLGNAFVTSDRIEIVPSEGIVLPLTTPPFQTFFVNRILKGYETKDKELAQSGKLDTRNIIRFEVSEKEGRVLKVSIFNYRENSRLNEILSTATWAFTRMLEKK